MKQLPNIRRPRGRGNNGRSHHPNSRNQNFDSSGPEGRIRGTANQIFDRYLAMARDALSAGDMVAAENYFQHAEHYYRMININGGNGQPQQSPRPRGEGNADEQAYPGELMGAAGAELLGDDEADPGDRPQPLV
ncbi:MAG: DUF4167 domain-containing protein [Alphaproteobacteria bacterium]|nr:DUF4167 domain-containing protein [Alphaproteobacteria bacterium]